MLSIFLWVLIDWVSQLGNFLKKINCMLIEREREREREKTQDVLLGVY